MQDSINKVDINVNMTINKQKVERKYMQAKIIKVVANAIDIQITELKRNHRSSIVIY